MTATAPTHDAYHEQFERFHAARREHDPQWLRTLRLESMAQFKAFGIPTRRHEEWRFTDVSEAVKTGFSLAGADSVEHACLGQALYAGSDAHRMVFVNGRYAPDLSKLSGTEDGLAVAAIAEDIRQTSSISERHLGRYVGTQSRPFAALNTAFVEDGSVIQVATGAIIRRPIHVLYLTTAVADQAVVYPRLLVCAGAGSQITVVEGYYGVGPATRYFNNAVTEIVADANAVVEHYRLQQEGESSCHISSLRIQQSRDSTVSSHSVSLGGRLVRNDVHAILAGENADCTLNGLFVETGRQHMDNHLRVEHVSPHTRSWEYYKGILFDRSRGVFSGRIFVHPDAQKTDAKQSNMNLLLSDEARINTKPQLEIFADDVKCTHGVTIGRLDADAMFYLRSRGVSESAARDLLVYAFAAESIEQIKPESMREEVGKILFDRLSNQITGR